MYSFTRTEINEICERIVGINGIDKFAQDEAIRCFREAVKILLLRIKTRQDPRVVDELVDIINRHINIGNVKDGTLVGNRIAEGMSVGVTQMAQSLFRMIEKVINLSEAASRASEIYTTSTDRTTQEIALHLDRSFAKKYSWQHEDIWDTHYELPDTIDVNKTRHLQNGNFSIYDISESKSIFTQMSVADILKNINRTKHIVVGVLKDFDGDNVSKPIRKERLKTIEFNDAPELEPGMWNKIQAIRNTKSKGSIYVLRLYLDTTVMYHNSITIEQVVEALNNNIKSGNEVYAVGSDFATGIIDIYPTTDLNITTKEKSENIFLYQNVALKLSSIIISGIPRVNGAAIQRIKLSKIIEVSEASPYHIGELGRKEWLKDYPEWVKSYNENNSPKIKEYTSIVDIDKNIVIVKEVKPSDYVLSGNVSIKISDDYTIVGYAVLSHKSNEDFSAPAIVLDTIYINKYLDLIDITNVWEIKLNLNIMVNECVDIDLIMNLLYYIGVKVISLVPHNIYRNYTGSIYVASDINPEELIRRHEEPEMNQIFINENGKAVDAGFLSENAVRYIYNTVGSDDWDTIEPVLASMDTTRIYYYYSLQLSVDRKGKNIKKTYIEKYLLSHVYSVLITYPIVDRYKTTSNDWSTMNYVLGAEANKNNYSREVKMLFARCDLKTDARHFGLHSEYTFEGPSSRGVGLSSVTAHNIGVFTEITVKEAVKGFYASTNRPAESVRSSAVAVLLGTPHLLGHDTVERFIKMSEAETQNNRWIEQRRAAIAPTTYLPRSEDDVESAITKALKFFIAEQDPYLSILTTKVHYEISDVPLVPDEIRPEFNSNIPLIIKEIQKSVEQQYNEIKSRRSYVKTVTLIKILSENTFYDANAITEFALLHFA